MTSDYVPFQSPITVDEYGNKQYGVHKTENCFSSHELYCNKNRLNECVDNKIDTSHVMHDKECVVNENDAVNNV